MSVFEIISVIFFAFMFMIALISLVIQIVNLFSKRK